MATTYDFRCDNEDCPEYGIVKAGNGFAAATCGGCNEDCVAVPAAVVDPHGLDRDPPPPGPTG